MKLTTRYKKLVYNLGDDKVSGSVSNRIFNVLIVPLELERQYNEPLNM